VPQSDHDPVFLETLARHGFGHITVPVPLVKRYSKGRRWTSEEFEACYEAWKAEKSLTFIAAALNRNPQDMIYKLLDRCKADGLVFSESGRSEGSLAWDDAVAGCAEELFERGLPAWKIAVLFQVDFEYVEKAVFAKRADYGHRKKNPFSICTDHKQFVNAQILGETDLRVRHALDAFAGEGKFAAALQREYPNASITCVDADETVFRRAAKKKWGPNVTWVCEDNREVMGRDALRSDPFDLIDLDPFVTCHEQTHLTWPLLRNRALLFVTFGGEYRRSFIRTNRKAICRRYGFTGQGLDNRAYLEVVPSFFWGWVAGQAAEHGFILKLLRSVRYPNNCRFWAEAKKVGVSKGRAWLEKTTKTELGGLRWLELCIPRFREVRWELDNRRQGKLF
jgi:hypothetical protein